MGPSRPLRRELVAHVSGWVPQKKAIGSQDFDSPAKLFDTLTLLPSFCPSNTPSTRFFVPFADLEKWSVAERRTRGATETVRLTSESVSAVVAGIVAVVECVVIGKRFVSVFGV